MKHREPFVTVLATPYVRGNRSTIECEQMPLSDALTRTFSTDAHMQLATSPKRRRCRLTVAEVGRTPIELHAVAFDFDGSDHRVDYRWRADFDARAKAAAPGAFAYHTRGGARLVGVLPAPFAIATELDARTWRLRYAAKCDELAGFGLDADRSCCDWQRLYRLPHATRELGGAPEALPVIGDARAIGIVELPPVAPSALTFPARRERSERQEAGVSSDSTPLLRDLQRAGLLVGPGPSAGSFRIICPRDMAHTTGTPGDGSTLYYPPRDWCGSGAIHCKHRCAEIRSLREWRRAIARYSGHRGSLRSPLAGSVPL